MQLSKRLQAVADYVTPGSRVADIGCDHAHTSIYLATNKIADYAIAMDINKGPIQRANENIEKYRCTEKIETRLSDGARKLKSDEVDTILISGMGGALIVKILSESFQVVDKAKELILQPQSEWRLVREYLHGIGFCIVKENMLNEDGKYYVVMKAIHGQEHYDREVFYQFGKNLLEEQNASLKQYIVYGKSKILIIREQLENHKTDQNVERMREVEQEYEFIKEGLAFYT